MIKKITLNVLLPNEIAYIVHESMLIQFQTIVCVTPQLRRDKSQDEGQLPPSAINILCPLDMRIHQASPFTYSLPIQKIEQIAIESLVFWAIFGDF